MRWNILGLPVDAVDRTEAAARCEEFLDGTGPRQVVTANPLMILAAEKDPGLRSAFADAALIVPDGVGLVIAAVLQGRRGTRVPGIELMERLCARAAETGRTVFLLGAAPGVVEAASRRLVELNPALKIAGTRHGYFSGEGEEAVAAVSRARPDLLFVALPTPFQDAWIHRNIGKLGAKVVMGVGGSFDVLSGRLRRAPSWMRSLGLEWLFRLIQEPGRWRRMLDLPIFLVRVLQDRGTDNLHALPAGGKTSHGQDARATKGPKNS